MLKCTCTLAFSIAFLACPTAIMTEGYHIMLTVWSFIGMTSDMKTGWTTGGRGWGACASRRGGVLKNVVTV